MCKDSPSKTSAFSEAQHSTYYLGKLDNHGFPSKQRPALYVQLPYKWYFARALRPRPQTLVLLTHLLLSHNARGYNSTTWRRSAHKQSAHNYNSHMHSQKICRTSMGMPNLNPHPMQLGAHMLARPPRCLQPSHPLRRRPREPNGPRSLAVLTASQQTHLLAHHLQKPARPPLSRLMGMHHQQPVAWRACNAVKAAPQQRTTCSDARVQHSNMAESAACSIMQLHRYIRAWCNNST